MKRLLILIGIVVCAIPLYAQKVHTVQRGETLESIARKYSVWESDLKDANPYLTLGCHVGQVLVVPDVKRMSKEEIEAFWKNWDTAYEASQNGDKAYDSKKYSAARKYYSEALELWPDDSDLYFNRGLCNYHLEKYGKAIDDFRQCIRFGYDDEMKAKAQKLIISAESKREERREVWGAVGAAVVGTALVVGGAALAANAQQQAYSGSSGYNPSPVYGTGTGGSFTMSDLDRIDAASNAAIAQNRSSIYAMSAYGIQQSRMEQARINAEFYQKTQELATETQWITDEHNPVNKLFWTICRDYEENPDSYMFPRMRFAALFREEYGREPTEKECALFEERFAFMLASSTPEGREAINEMIEEQKENNRKFREEQEEQWEQERQERMARYRNSSFSSNSGASSSSSTSSATKSSSSGSSYSSGSKAASGGTDKDVFDSRQQYKNDPVSSSDYRRIKSVTLYYRDGDKAKVKMQNVDLCRKGGRDYIKIGNEYYPRCSPNWMRFSNAITYGFEQLYYND